MKFKYKKLDTEQAKSIEQKLKDNGGYCPCALVQDDDHKCMCKAFRESQSGGSCHCGLYYKEII